MQLGLGEISIFKKPCEDSDRDMLIKELVAGMSALDDTARTGCAAVCFGVSGIPLRPAAHRGRVEREPPVHRRVPGVCPVYLLVHGSMAENTHQLGQFEVHVAANVAKKARR